MPVPDKPPEARTRKRRAATTSGPGATPINRRSTTYADQGSRGVSHRGATAAYLAGRERLRRRVTVPLDAPAAAFDAIAEALGGRRLAGEYVDQMRAEVEAQPWEHDPNCTMCGTWRRRLERVGS